LFGISEWDLVDRVCVGAERERESVNAVRVGSVIEHAVTLDRLASNFHSLVFVFGREVGILPSFPLDDAHCFPFSPQGLEVLNARD